jgi:hypothetical protein
MVTVFDAFAAFVAAGIVAFSLLSMVTCEEREVSFISSSGKFQERNNHSGAVRHS